MLKVSHISIGYGGRILVPDISFEIAPGEVILLAGANGTGKTTLLKALGRDFRRSEGISAHTVLIPTNIPKVKGFTVGGFIQTSCYAESDWNGRIPEEVRKRLDEALELLGIQALKKRDIATLSDGEFQKACLAVGLTRKAEVLLLDEPTAFLDVENRIDVLQTLKKAARNTGTAVLFSSHDLHDALQVADRVFALTRDGRFVASSRENCLETLRQAFPFL